MGGRTETNGWGIVEKRPFKFPRGTKTIRSSPNLLPKPTAPYPAPRVSPALRAR